VRHEHIVKRFEGFLRGRSLKLTGQRRRVLDPAFGTHEHFSAEQLFAMLKAEGSEPVSRATVYRTIGLLLEGGFVEALDTGSGELKYEHILGHHHHDHMLCLGCGRIEEFHDERIEALQEENCRRRGFELVSHDLRLRGYCRSCARKRARKSASAGGARG
jgi:Fur family transcriptional regulator, ferric uptake regulator